MKKIQHKIQELQIENKQLKNRMADIKSNYLSQNLIYVVVQIDKL